MAAFRFSLHQVLKYRTQLEDQAKVRFAKAQADRLAAERRLDELRVQLAEQERRLYGDGPDPLERWLIEHYVRGLREDIAHTSRLLRELAQLVEQARIDLVARAKERKILDKLREKQANLHAREERLQEQRTYDETTSIRYQVAAL